jgi:hypothetical protein
MGMESLAKNINELLRRWEAELDLEARRQQKDLKSPSRAGA